MWVRTAFLSTLITSQLKHSWPYLNWIESSNLNQLNLYLSEQLV